MMSIDAYSCGVDTFLKSECRSELCWLGYRQSTPVATLLPSEKWLNDLQHNCCIHMGSGQKMADMSTSASVFKF